jgi:hypothetical protein
MVVAMVLNKIEETGAQFVRRKKEKQKTGGVKK